MYFGFTFKFSIVLKVDCSAHIRKFLNLYVAYLGLMLLAMKMFLLIF